MEKKIKNLSKPKLYNKRRKVIRQTQETVQTKLVLATQKNGSVSSIEKYLAETYAQKQETIKQILYGKIKQK